MRHIYIHIPFCLKRCGYCDFFAVTDRSMVEKYVAALSDEIALQGERYSKDTIDTIFFGGGTPSLLEPIQLETILSKVQKSFTLSKNPEITMEANPETVDRSKLATFWSAGINRLSVGVQSFNDNDLQYLGRVHDSKQAVSVLGWARDIFNNLSLDLIYGIPGQALIENRYNLEKALTFNPDHISCYELTYEEETLLFDDKDIRPDDDGEAFLLIQNFLKHHGYNHYEISNYSHSGFECRHNLAYWSDRSYLGFGASAHSYDAEQGERWSNTLNLNNYLNREWGRTIEPSQDIDRLFTGLRKMSGLSTADIPEDYKEAIAQLIEEGFLAQDQESLRLSEKGILFSNHVVREIMIRS